MMDMDREPFAVVVEYKETGRPYRVEVGGVEMEGGSSPAHSEFLARLVNDAFNKRLDEEIAKAMEPLVHELKRLMDVVGEEDHKLIGDVVAEWERGK